MTTTSIARADCPQLDTSDTSLLRSIVETDVDIHLSRMHIHASPHARSLFIDTTLHRVLCDMENDPLGKEHAYYPDTINESIRNAVMLLPRPMLQVPAICPLVRPPLLCCGCMMLALKCTMLAARRVLHTCIKLVETVAFGQK